MSISVDQSRINAVLDNLSLKFFANHGEEELKNAGADGSIPFIWCDEPVDGAIPGNILNNNTLLVQLVDRIHELMSSIHSEWRKWSLQCFDMDDGHSYFVLLHEDACVADLYKFVEEVCASDDETLIWWFDVQEAVDHSRPLYPQLYEAMKVRGLSGVPLRTWRDHSAYYEFSSEDDDCSYILSESDSEEEDTDRGESEGEDEDEHENGPEKPIDMFYAVEEIHGVFAVDKTFVLRHKWQYLDKGMTEYQDLSDDMSGCIETCYTQYLAAPHLKDTQSVESKLGTFKLDFINMTWENKEKKYKLQRTPIFDWNV